MRNQKKLFRDLIPRFFQYLILIVISIVVLTPIITTAMGGLKNQGEFMSAPYAIPDPVRWDNVINITGQFSFWQMFINSLIVMVCTTAGVVLFCSLTAFVFARLNFPGKDLSYNLFTLGLMFPINVAILPVFILLRQLGWTNMLFGVIIVQIAFNLSGNILILRSFFMSIPSELQDAAYMDGCSAFGFYWRVLMPLAKPSLSAVAALTMIVSWNDLLVPLVVLDKENLWTLPLGTMQFQGQYGTDLSAVAAFVTLSAIPTIVFYLLAERQIVSGLMAGAIKG